MILMSAGEPNELVGKARHREHERHLDGGLDQDGLPGWPRSRELDEGEHRREHKDAGGDDKDQERSAAARVEPRCLSGPVHGEFSSFEGMDAFVFGTVVLKHSSDVRQASDGKEVAQKQGQLDAAGEEMKGRMGCVRAGEQGLARDAIE